MGDLSLHFSLSEFALPEAKAARHGCEPAAYPAEWVEARLAPLVRALEVRPVVVEVPSTSVALFTTTGVGLGSAKDTRFMFIVFMD